MRAVSGYLAMAGRNLRVHLKRTLLTVLGVVLSVALMCAGGLFGESLRARGLENVRLSSGGFHAFLEGVSREQVEDLAVNAKVGDVGFAASLGRSQVAETLTLWILGADRGYCAAMNFVAQGGRLPAMPGEIALEAWIMKAAGRSVSLGDAISLDVRLPGAWGTPEGRIERRTFTVTGLLEPRLMSQATGRGMAVVTPDEVEAVQGVHVAWSAGFTVRDGLPVQESIMDIAAGFGVPRDRVRQNTPLLTAMGVGSNRSVNRSVVNIEIILALIVLVATVAVISNTFAISVIERTRQLGILRCVGATPAQLRLLVFREAAVVCAAGIPLGIASGTAAVFLVIGLFAVISTSGRSSGLAELGFRLSLPIMAGSAALGLLSVFLSSLGPALRAGRIPPLEAVIAPGRAVGTRVKSRRHAVMSALFGVSGRMAARNIARNRRRFLVTVVSIALGVSLHVIFSGFLGMAFRAQGSREGGLLMRDVALYSSAAGEGREFSPANVEAVRRIGGVKGVLAAQEENGALLLDEAAAAESLAALSSKIPSVRLAAAAGGKVPVPAAILGLGAEEIGLFRPRIYEGDFDPIRMGRENGVFITPAVSTPAGVVRLSGISVGDRITVVGGRSDAKGEGAAGGNETGAIRPVTVTVFGFASSLDYSSILDPIAVGIVTTTEVFQRLTGKDTFTRVNVELADRSESADIEAALVPIASRVKGARVMDLVGSQRLERETFLQISILLYGLVVVIGLIGALNIVNTVGTNLILRVRELGMLRAVGMTDPQIRSMVALEGVLYGLYSTLPGSAVGVLLSRILYANLASVQKIPWVVPWAQIAAACAVAIALGTISALVPLRRIGRSSVVESIRAEE